MKLALIVIGIIVLGYFAIATIVNSNVNPPGGQSQGLLNLNNNASPTPTPTKNMNQDTSDFISAKTAIIKTAKGEIDIQFYPEDAPKTVTNFATLSKRGYYNGLTFHRVEDWVVQGGDPTGTGAGGQSIYGRTFEDELNPNTPSYKEGYVEGIVAMANAGPNTNGSQFFILTKDTPLSHAYTIFGKVTKGMDIVKQIAAGDKMLEISVQQ